jgi:hypothetical protein
LLTPPSDMSIWAMSTLTLNETRRSHKLAISLFGFYIHAHIVSDSCTLGDWK